jgi:hypothetical protein
MANIESGKTHKEAQYPEELWSYASGGNGYTKGPEVVIAEYMQKKGFGVSVRSEENRPGVVAIYASPQEKTKLDSLIKTPEYSAIFNALAGHVGKPEEPNVEKCEWDGGTKRRVQALYWQNRWQYAQHMLESPVKLAQASGGLPWITGAEDAKEGYAEYLREVIQGAKLQEQRLLRFQRPLDTSDVSHLLEEVVYKYLFHRPHSNKG